MDKKKKTIVILIIILTLLIILLIYVNIRLTGAAIADKNNENVYLFQEEFTVTKLEDIDYLLEAFIGERPFFLHLRTDPREAAKVPSEEDIRLKTLKDTQQIYVTLDPNSGSSAIVAVFEITKITGDSEIFNIPTTATVTNNNGREEVLVKTCDDATKSERVIQIQIAEETNIHSEGDCIVIEGTDEDELIKASNKFILQILGIL